MMCKYCGAQEPNVDEMFVMFDIDDTLVMWEYPQELEDKTILFDNYGVPVRLLPHYKHIDQLKRHAARGHTVICWSAGGRRWAKAVVEALGLSQYVYDVISKPQFYYDDLKSEEFLPEVNRVYYNPYTGLEKTKSDVNEEEPEHDHG